MCGDAEDAKDVLQDTLLAASRTVGDFRGDSSVSTWLFTIARSFCIKKRRRSKFAPHVVHSLVPWVTLWEQAMERDLLTERELDDGYMVKFSVNGLLRGDVKSRGEFYKAGINDGWMTRNEARELEDMNPLPGLDEPLSPMNMQAPGGSPKPNDP